MSEKEPTDKIIPSMQPLDDYMFSRQLNGMESALQAQSLINAVFRNSGRKPIDKIKNLKCQSVILGEFNGNRGCRLDVEAQTGGRFVNIELQITKMTGMVDRMAFYWSKMLTMNTPENTKFNNLPKATVISLTDFIVRKNHDDFHQPLALYYEKGERQRASEILDFHLIEIPKFRQIKPDINNLLHCWLYYLDEGYKYPESELTKEVLRMDAGIKQFAEHFNKNVMDKDFQMDYFNYQMALLDEQNRIETARKAGKTEGIEEGKIKTICSMYKHNTPMQKILDIAKEQGISKSEVYAVLKIQPKKEAAKPSLIANVKEKQDKIAKTPRKKAVNKQNEIE